MRVNEKGSKGSGLLCFTVGQMKPFFIHFQRNFNQYTTLTHSILMVYLQGNKSELYCRGIDR